MSYESFKFGVEFAGGGQAFTDRRFEMSYEDEPDKPFLYPGGTISKWHREDSRWWVWPLPPPGQLKFICALGETTTQVSMDAQPILDASQRSIQVWSGA